MLAIGFALLASLAWGAADYLGGERSRAHAVLTVLLVSQAAGLVVLGAILAVRGAPPPGETGFVAGALIAGTAGAVGLSALYRGLAIGPMGVVAPISALSAVVPVVAGFVRDERPSGLQAAGIALAITGVVLAARTPSAGGRAPVSMAAVGLALVAALALGTGTLGLDAASEADPLWGTFGVRTAMFVLVIGASCVARPPVLIGRAQLVALAGIGLLDTAATMAFAQATHTGLISVVGVLGQLYPVVVVLLARFLLAERLVGGQRAGVVIALGGVGLIAAG